MSLREAVENWIRAEYEYRFGPAKYTGDTQQDYCDAEDALREAVAGSSDLVTAASRCGVRIVRRDTPKDEPDQLKLTYPKRKRPVTNKVKKKIKKKRSGLFH